jgi:predicted MFS family arabinose efflux permease
VPKISPVAHSRSYRTYCLWLLTLVNSICLVDRGLMMLLLQPIKEDLRLTDTQLGLVTGIAFGLLYASLGIPIARWADRGNRPNITTLAMGVWAFSVMACLLVTNFTQLVLARLVASVGEAGCKPPSYSLIGDYFVSQADRVRAMGVFALNNPFAAMISFIAGGWLSEVVGWRATFFLMGLPALALAILVKATVIEPRGPKVKPEPQNEALPLRRVVKMTWETKSLRYIGLAVVLHITSGLGLGVWYGVFMIRAHHLTTAFLGLWFGLIFGFSGIAGSLFAGHLGAKWADSARRYLVLTSAIEASIPALLSIMVMTSNIDLALAAFLLLQLASSFCVIPAFSFMQQLAPAASRATVYAIVILVANLFGLGVAPLLVGVFSDTVTPLIGTDALRYGMLLVSLFSIGSSFYFWRSARTIAADLKEYSPQSAPAPEVVELAHQAVGP